MKRILASAATAFSAMLLMATIIVWVRSHFVSDSVTWTSQRATILGVGWGAGKFDLVSARSDPRAFVESEDSLSFEKPKAGWEVQHTRPPNLDDWSLVTPQHELKFLGAKFRSGEVLFMYVRDLTLPLWMLAVIFAIAPTRWIILKSRRRPGSCPICGYDLRATPQRCPECGRTPQSDATQPPERLANHWGHR